MRTGQVLRQISETALLLVEECGDVGWSASQQREITITLQRLRMLRAERGMGDVAMSMIAEEMLTYNACEES